MRASHDPYYAVIFTSQLTSGSDAEYAAVADQMVELAKVQPGFLSVDSARSEDGVGITVSYWQSETSIQAWKNQVDHAEARKKGRADWYSWFKVRICKVEREYSMGSADDSQGV